MNESNNNEIIFSTIKESKIFSFSHKNLRKLSPEIGLLHKLRYLDLQYNLLTELPSEIWQCPLIVLSISYNKLGNLPQGISKCSKLEALYLSNNEITDLPKDIWQCFRLQILNLTNNKLKTLPEGMDKCTGLKQLLLSENDLQSLPPSEKFLECQLLQEIYIRNNPIPKEEKNKLKKELDPYLIIKI